MCRAGRLWWSSFSSVSRPSQSVKHPRTGAVVFADVRDSGRVRHSRSPFSTMTHGAAAGEPESWTGRYNIPHLGLFVWRQSAQPLWPVEDGDVPDQGGPNPWKPAGLPGLMRFDPFGARPWRW